MTHPILSVKMYELDKKLEQTHSRIQFAETMDTERLHQQIQNLRQECAESRITLENRLHYSKTGCVTRLANVFDQVEAAVEKAYGLAEDKDVILAFGSLSFIGIMTEAVEEEKKKRKEQQND